uniref:PH domain-containing protein n=1 Tax=Timema bartmani TaxID=61472 RepID=A0A7R9I3N3_9NEOP|nr:unnamed protein product [Timema bartmani]
MDPSEDSVRKARKMSVNSTKDELVSVQYVSSSCLNELEYFFHEAEVHIHRMSEDIQAMWYPWFIMTGDDPFVIIPPSRTGSDSSRSETTISSTSRDQSTSLVRFQPDRCRMEGVLCKWTNPIEGWRYLFFVLDDVVGKLHYFTSKQKLLRGERRGSVTLRRARVLRDEVDTSAFSIAVDRKRLYFQARDPNEREAWVEALQSAIVEQSIGQNDSDDDPDPKEQCTSSSSHSPTQDATNTSEDRVEIQEDEVDGGRSFETVEDGLTHFRDETGYRWL